MNRIETRFEGVYLLEPKVFGDNRGYFTESYNRERLLEFGMEWNFVQDNESLSARAGTIRGLHYQLNPMAQTKIVRVLSGAIYDVVVDIRKGSPTFAEWSGFILTAENRRQLLVPEGFAHGFCTLVPDTKITYKVDNHYSPQHDRGILWNDPDLAIDWPFTQPVLSDKDEKYPRFRDAEMNF